MALSPFPPNVTVAPKVLMVLSRLRDSVGFRAGRNDGGDLNTP